MNRVNYTKPLTPTFRKQIEEGIDKQWMKLSECQNTPYASVLRTGLKAARTLIHGLPDGFPIPIEKER